MNTTVLLFHPDIDSSRVNRAMAQSLDENIDVRDMYALYSDFRIDSAEEHRVLARAERIILQFPIYWYSSPALLKQWEDDVLHAHTGELDGKQLMLAVTFGANNYGRDRAMKYTPSELLRPFQSTARLTGMTYLKPFVVLGASNISDAQLQGECRGYAAQVSDPKVQMLGDFE